MLKVTSVALGLLTLLSLAPAAQAVPLIIGGDRNSQPQIKVIVNPQSNTTERRDDDRYRQYPEHRHGRDRYREEQERYRQIQARKREARERWEAAHRRRDSDDYRYKDNDRREDRERYEHYERR